MAFVSPWLGDRAEAPAVEGRGCCWWLERDERTGDGVRGLPARRLRDGVARYSTKPLSMPVRIGSGFSLSTITVLGRTLRQFGKDFCRPPWLDRADGCDTLAAR